MQPISQDAARYDRTTMVLHWLTAVLVVCQWVGAQLIDLFARGAPRVDARSVHIVGGALLAGILLARVIWRLTRGRRLKLADKGMLGVLAKATHWALYALLVAMVLAGFALAWTRGDSLFNLVTIPAYAPGNRALVDQVQNIHATIGWAIVVLAGLHAAAALAHRLVWRDCVLARMLPGG